MAGARIRAATLAALLGGLALLAACGGTAPGVPSMPSALDSTAGASGTVDSSAGPPRSVSSSTDATAAPASQSAASAEPSLSPEPSGFPTTRPATTRPTTTGPESATAVSSSTTTVPTSTTPRPETTSATAGASTAIPPLPDVGLAGVNDPACRSEQPPVLLLHGSFSTVAGNFRPLVPALIADGRCVYGIDYGDEGTGPIKDSAAAVATFVGEIRFATGAPQIDVVGYSQGGLVLRTALRLDGIADDVRVAVLIAPSFHGTTSPLAAAVPSSVCAACADQAAGSALLRQLDAGGDLDGSVRYAVLSTRHDTIVTPVESQVPRGPADRVRSLLVEAACPSAHVDHLSLPAFPGLPSWVVATLDTDGRPSPSSLTCG